MTIVSHKYKLIFLKTRKTAGSSIEASIARYCDSGDIISSASDIAKYGISSRYRNDIRSCRELGWNEWLPYMHNISQYLIKCIKNKKLPDKKKVLPRYAQHMPAAYLRSALGERIWKDYFKVCFERNPYDRLVSFYFWRRKRIKTNCSFEEFAKTVFFGNNREKQKLAADNFSNRKFYLENNNIIVDYVGKYETLTEDLQHICDQCGIDFDGWLPMAKANTREKRSYHDMYTPELIKMAKKNFEIEESLFGYDF